MFYGFFVTSGWVHWHHVCCDHPRQSEEPLWTLHHHGQEQVRTETRQRQGQRPWYIYTVYTVLRQTWAGFSLNKSKSFVSVCWGHYFVALGSLTVILSGYRCSRTSKGPEGHWHHPVDNEADLETPRQRWRRENQELFHREEMCHWQGLDKGEHFSAYFTVCSWYFSFFRCFSILVHFYYYSYFIKHIPWIELSWISSRAYHCRVVA